MQRRPFKEETLIEKIEEAESLAERIPALAKGQEQTMMIMRWALVGDEATALIEQAIAEDPANEFLVMLFIDEHAPGCWYKYRLISGRFKAVAGKSLEELNDEALAKVGFLPAAQPGDLVELVKPFWLVNEWHEMGEPPDYAIGSRFRVITLSEGKELAPEEVELMAPDLYEALASATPPAVTATLILPRSYIKKVEP